MSAAAQAVDPTLRLVLRLVGASHLALAIGHLVLWRLFDWGQQLPRLSPLTARVFVVHTFFIAFVLAALGALALGRPDLLTARSDLARLLLSAVVLFWSLRLLAQPLIFDPVFRRDPAYRAPLRAAAWLLFASYVLVYGWALAGQWR